MSSWSKHRKLAYASVVIVIVAVAAFVPAFYFLYKPPTCFDGVKNGSEQGIDCRRGLPESLRQRLLGTGRVVDRFEQVVPGVYNLAAYLVNPNSSGEAANVPYHMVVYDAHGIPLTDVAGRVTLPPQRNTLAFLPGVSVGKQAPYRVFFELTAAPDWYKRSDPLAALMIGDKNYRDTASGSSLSVTLRNGGVILSRISPSS